MVKKVVTAVVMAGVAAAAGLMWRRLLARWEPEDSALSASHAWPDKDETAVPA